MQADQWQKLSLMEQLANIGSEVSRAHNWQTKDPKIFWSTVDRALELWDLTISDPRWRSRLKELTRSREVFCSAVLNSPEYNTTLADLQKYFLYFGIAARENI